MKEVGKFGKLVIPHIQWWGQGAPPPAAAAVAAGGRPPVRRTAGGTNHFRHAAADDWPRRDFFRSKMFQCKKILEDIKNLEESLEIFFTCL